MMAIKSAIDGQILKCYNRNNEVAVDVKRTTDREAEAEAVIGRFSGATIGATKRRRTWRWT